jgi:peptidoglycan hydrolase-like protein with peptidoglycan-binding domain
MRRRARILSTVAAGSLALAAVGVGTGLATGKTATNRASANAALAARTEVFPAVVLDNCPTLHTGYPQGECVAQLQTDLNTIQGNHLAVDGVFGAVGSQTYQAVVAFQRADGLPPDGMVGPETKKALDAALSVPTPTPPSPASPASSSAPAAPSEYVALGDSFSSGEGNPKYDLGTDVSADRCHRSPVAYPHLLAQGSGGWNLGADDFVACSGSTVQNVVYGQTSGTHSEGPQLSKLNDSTSRVTISVGGNDVNFQSVANDCVYGVNFPEVTGSRDCADKVFTGSSSTDGMTLREYEDQLISNLGQDHRCTAPAGDAPAQCSGPVPSLAHLYELIQRDAPNASIYVLLYPHLFNDEPGSAQCDLYGLSAITSRVGAHIFISQANQQFLNNGVDQVDTEIIGQVAQAEAAGVNVRFIDPRLLFDNGGQGHGVCSAHPWLNGLHLTPNGYRVLGPALESFHPNPTGQAEFAQAIQEGLR